MDNTESVLLEKLKNHVGKNLIHFQNVSSEILILFANLGKDEYLCFDTESCRDYNDNSKERVWCWSLSNTINDLVVYGYTIDNFIEFIKSLRNYKEFNFNKKSKTKNINLNIWVHNLAWDFEFMKYWCNENDYKYYSKILYDDNSVEDEFLDCNSWTITENNGQVYNSTISIKMNDLVFGKKHFKSFIKIKMIDSVKVITDSLDEIGRNIISIDEMFYKLKDNFDYERIRPYDYKLDDIEKCYIYNDVYILKEFIRQYYIMNNLNGFTASSIAFNNMLNFKFPEFKKKYEEFEKRYPVVKDLKIRELIDRSYSGGFTYSNPTNKGKHVKKLGHSMDLNSSYPARMKFNKLPYDIPKYFKGKYKKDKVYDIALQKIHFDGFKRKNNSPIGFIKIGSCDSYLEDIKKYGYKNNDYISSNFNENGELLTMNYNLVLTLDELEFMLSVYDFYTYRRLGDKVLKGSKNLIEGVEYVEGVKFKSCIGDFGDFIDDCLERKNKYKKERNVCGVTVAKKDMNSLYGKMGSGYERTIMNCVVDEKGYFKHERKYENDMDFDYEENRKYYRAYSSFTTSYGRLSLFKVIVEIEEKYGQQEFLYCDTDSVYATLSLDELLSLDVEVDKYKLGAWDIEKVFTEFKCLGAKKYLVYGHDFGEDEIDKLYPHCAGLPYKTQEKLTFNNFYLGAIYQKKQKKKVIGGYRLEDISFELKEFTFHR